MFENIKTKIANRVLYFLFYRIWRKFWQKSNYVDNIQTEYLKGLLQKNAKTQFGQKHNFNQINNVLDFQMSVPISDYENYIEYIDSIKKGKKSVLTTDAVIKFSLSSGTATASKNIPNNRSLLKEFDNCISVWLCDLYQNFPQIMNGRAFWIITPSTKIHETIGIINTGFDNDSEYFSPIKQWFIRNIFTVPDEVAQYCQGENYYFVIATFLLLDKNLRLISVWNPSILLILLDKTRYYQNQIIESIEKGQLLVPEPMDLNHLKILEKRFKKNYKRANELYSIFRSNFENSRLWSIVWPNLTLISAWDSAWASTPANQVKKIFPNVSFQGKGLLATEACITFPVNIDNNKNEYIPAFTSHFFEFECIDTKEIKLVHQLNMNMNYEVIVTTGGGLYRYRLNDIVYCCGFSRGLPLLRFEGKSNLISDITGEKLHESHVIDVLKTVFDELKIQSTFYFIAPEISNKNCFYILFIYTLDAFDLNILQEKVELSLCENFHYKHSREMEQLQKLKIQILNKDSITRFYSIIQSNTHLGASKQSVLRKETFWLEKLSNCFQKP